MSWMIKPIEFGGYAPDANVGAVESFSRDMQNIRFNDFGGIESIDGWSGYTDATAGAGQFNAIFATDPLSSATRAEIVGWRFTGTSNPSRLYSIATTPYTLLSGFTDILSANTGDNNMAYFTVLADKLLISVSSGAVQPMIWTGSPSTTLSAMLNSPTGKYPATHYNRIFLASSANNPSRVWWSPLYLSADWSTGASGNWMDINRDDGDVITGIKSFGGDLYTWKVGAVYRTSGNDFDITSGNFVTTKMEGVPGCKWFNSIVEAEGALYWYSDEGFIKFSGGSITPIGLGKVDNTSKTYYMNDPQIYRDMFRGAYRKDRGEIWWSTGRGDLILVYNVALDKWSKVVPAQQINSIYFTSLFNALYEVESPFTLYGGMSGANTGFFSACITPQYFNNTKNFNGVAINSYYTTDFMNLGAKQHKDSPRVIIYPDGYNKDYDGTSLCPDLSASVYIDYDPIAVNNYKFDTTDKYFQDFYPTIQSFRRMQIKVASNILNKKLVVNGIDVECNADTESGRI